MDEIRTFEELTKGRRWRIILNLLKRKSASIPVAEAQVVSGQGGGVFIDEEGFKEWSGLVGEAAAYSNRKSEVKPLDTHEKVREAIRECDNGTPPLPSETELIKMILRRVTEIREAN